MCFDIIYEEKTREREKGEKERETKSVDNGTGTKRQQKTTKQFVETLSEKNRLLHALLWLTFQMSLPHIFLLFFFDSLKKELFQNSKEKKIEKRTENEIKQK